MALFWGSTSTGYVFGGGGDISARIYRKCLEIIRSQKHYMLDIWRGLGWIDGQKVIRVEFQLRSKVLREFGCRSMEDLSRLGDGMWAYCASEWLRLTTPVEADGNRSRWPTHPAWELLSRTTYSGEPVKRRATKITPKAPRDEDLFSRAISVLTSWMAKYDITNPYDAWNQLIFKCQGYHEGWADYRDEDFEGHTLTRAAIKAKQWGLVFGEWQAKADAQFLKAEADAYRNAKKKGS